MANRTKFEKVHVGVVGGGLAGLSAAAVLQSHGCQVDIFEARKALGGRAGSFRDFQTGRTIDRCQHVAMGCCTYLADFCSRVGLGESFKRHKKLHFFAPGPRARRYDFSASDWLPAPLHLLPAMMRLGYLGLGERFKIISALRRLINISTTDEPVEQWLRRNGQSDRTLEQFWAIVLESALSEKLGHASLHAARKVFVDGFMNTRDGYELLIPSAPLIELFDRQAGDYLQQKGVKINRATRVTRIEENTGRGVMLTLSSGKKYTYDALVVAVPWYSVQRLCESSLLDALPNLKGVEKILAAPITALHFWHDRCITDLPHSVFIGRISQWLFNHGDGYTQVVVSASHDLLERNREDICQEIIAEVGEVFSNARNARLLHWRMVTEPRAVFSLRPGVKELRPSQKTSLHNLALAGDWTDTGWPATMEGAVRSGYSAANVIMESAKSRAI
jgi:squalene-associated FAD-dependent desaturase